MTEPPPQQSEDVANRQEENRETSGEGMEGNTSNALLTKISAINEVRYLRLRGCTLIIQGSNLQEQDFKEAIKGENSFFESAEIRSRRVQPDGNLTGFEIILKLRNPIRK